MREERLARLRAIIAQWSVIIVAAGSCGCQFPHELRGQVIEFGNGRPVAGATVTARAHGWGLSQGSLVWDKDKSVRVESGSDGRFHLSHRSGSSVELWVEKAGFVRYSHWYPSDAVVEIKLRRSDPKLARLPTGFLALGLFTSGQFYGWSFALNQQVSSADQADLLPEFMEQDIRGRVVVRALGNGGIQFVPSSQLGVDSHFLVYSDEAPPDGYQATAVLDFRSEGGIYFVRTRDGRHFAKFEFTPSGFGSRADRGIRRDLQLRFVYNPDGSRRLPFQEP